jgi:hypothetical protein
MRTGVKLVTTLSAGVAPWRSFGGAAIRVNGMVLRVLSKPLVVEPAQ